MANTYIPISSVTVGSGGATSIDFINIPNTHTDLVLKLSGRSTGTNGTCVVYFNNDTTNSNYTALRLYSNASGPTIAGASYSAPYFLYTNQSSQTSNTFASDEMYIPNYTSSNQKSISTDSVKENNAADADIILTSGKWTGTSAINRITIRQQVDTGFVQYTTATLYGIKNS